MRNIKDESLKISKNKKNNTRPKTKSFGYQILGMGGGTVVPPFSFDYLVVAGGGGGGRSGLSGGGGGAGAGGYRASGYGPSPLRGSSIGPGKNCGTYPIVVGGGGAGGSPPSKTGTDGVNSSFAAPSPFGITSEGGGGGGSKPGSYSPSAADGGNGGPGIVIIRAPADKTLTVTPGTNTTSTHPAGCKLATFTVTGCLTIS